MHPREVAIVGALLLLLLVPWLVVRDIWRQPVEGWRHTGRSRWVWTAVAVLVPVLGPAWYVRVVRPEVRSALRPDGPRSRA